jgi:hypothetical protein
VRQNADFFGCLYDYIFGFADSRAIHIHTEPAYGQRLFPLEQPQRARSPIEDAQDDPKWKTSRPGIYSLEKTKIEVRTESNIFSVFERGKPIYSNALLAQAKAFAEKRADDLVMKSEKARREQQQREGKAAH